MQIRSPLSKMTRLASPMMVRPSSTNLVTMLMCICDEAQIIAKQLCTGLQAVMSCILMLLSGIHGFASSVTSRLWQAYSSVITWIAPAAGGRHMTTAGVCILLTCCGNATRYGLKRMAQGHQQHCLQAATGFAKGQLFLDSGLIHDVSLLINIRRLSEPKMVMGLTGPQAIKFTGHFS